MRTLLGGMLVTAVLTGLTFTSAPTPSASADTYACPDMTGPGGLPDGHVDASDLSAFAAAKASQSPAGDFSGDGVVDNIDQALFSSVFGQSDFSCDSFWKLQHSRTPSCVDMNFDGVVDASDVSAFAAAKGSQDMVGDFSGDGQVNDIDQAILESRLGTYGNCGIVVDFYPDPILPPLEVVTPDSLPTAAIEPQPVPASVIEPEQTAPATSGTALAVPLLKPVPVVVAPEARQKSAELSLRNDQPEPVAEPSVTVTATTSVPTDVATLESPVSQETATRSFFGTVWGALSALGQAIAHAFGL